jgi:hypothetical protein
MQECTRQARIIAKYERELLPHFHFPYSPDTSPLDFDLLPELNKQMQGEYFDSTEDMYADMN